MSKLYFLLLADKIPLLF